MTEERFSAIAERAPASSSRPTRRRRLRRGWWRVYVPLLATFTLLGLFSYYPAVSGLSHAFYDWRPGFSSPFVGLSNFRQMLHDSIWWESFWHVGQLLLWGVTLAWVFPLLAAELVITLRSRRAQTVFRVLLIVPLAFPLVVNVLIWGFIYDPNVGIANRFFHGVGLGGLAHNWLGDPHTALYALILMGFPWIASLPFLVFLGALQAIPKEVFEAARVDGAGRWRRFLHIDLPMLRRQFALLLVLAVITVVQYGIPAAILTNGGPAFATTVPVTHMLDVAFQGGEWGYAAALSSTLFLIILGLSAVVAIATLRQGRSRSRILLTGPLTRRLRGLQARTPALRLPSMPGWTHAASLRRRGPSDEALESEASARRHVATAVGQPQPRSRPDRADSELSSVRPAGDEETTEHRSTGPRRRSHRRRGSIAAGMLLSLFAFLGLFPYLFMIVASWKDNAQFYRSYWVPSLPLHLHNYGVAWSQIRGYLLNTVIVAGASVLGAVLLSTITAFVFARYRFLGRNTLFALIAVLLMVPGIATLIPLFVLVHNLGLLNTRWVLILPYITNGTILGTVLVRVFIQQLPDEIFDAARVDGAGGVRVYRHIVMPLALPIVGTVAILTAIGVWNDYFWPVVTITNNSLRTIPIGLAFFSGQNVTQWGPLFAGYTLASLPLLALFVFAARYFLTGLQGGVRGSG